MAENGNVWRVVAGQDNQIRWRAPVAITGSPTLTLHHPTLGDVNVPLSIIHAAISVTAVSAGRRRLTASGSVPTMAGVAGEDGRAFFIEPAGDAHPVVVLGLDNDDDTLVRLGHGLPTGVKASGASPGSLQFATWTGTIEGAVAAKPATSALADPFRWTLSYSEQAGANVPAQARVAEGLVYVQAPPWPGTGLTSQSLEVIDPSVGDMLPRSQADWSMQIAAALRDLRARLASCRSDISMGDDLVDGALLHDPHAYLTLAIIYQKRSTEYADYLRNQAQEQLERVCHLLLSEDENGDLVDAPGRKAPPVGGTFAGDRAFTEEAGER